MSILDVYCSVDTFWQRFEPQWERELLAAGQRRRRRATRLHPAEILTILILFLVGGEVTRGFAFAMLIGVITGTYSSIFVAAPFLVDFAKGKPLGKDQAPTVEKAKPTPTTTAKAK